MNREVSQIRTSWEFGGAKGISQLESAILNAAASARICPPIAGAGDAVVR